MIGGIIRISNGSKKNSIKIYFTNIVTEENGAWVKMWNCELYAKLLVLSYANFNAVADALGLHSPFFIGALLNNKKKDRMPDLL